MRRWVAVLVIASFVLGTAVGMLGQKFLSTHSKRSDEQIAAADQVRKALEKAGKKLELNSEQHEKWLIIGESAAVAWQEAHDQRRERLAEVREKYVVQLRELLTDEQKARFDQMADKWRRNMEKRGEQ